MARVRARTACCVATVVTAFAVIAGCQSSSGGGSGASAKDASPSPASQATSSTPATTSSTSGPASGSGSGSGAAAGSVPNPCDLVTRGDAKAVLGLDPGDGLHAPTDVADTCTYHRNTRLVSVVVRKLSQSTFDTSASKTADTKAISGLGPEVYQVGDIIEFWKSGLQIAVGVDSGGSNSLAKEKNIVKAAMGRL